MGSASFDPSAYRDYAATTAAKGSHASAVFTRSSLHEDLDPMKMKNGMRESRDSAVNPNSNPIILGFDVTGSMGEIPNMFIREGLGIFFRELYDRQPVANPHLLLAAIGDIDCDSTPFQISQFEAGVEPITDQLEKFYLEGGGGGNDHESYSLAWLFAAMHTSCDAFEKRGKKGYLFTVGDERPTPSLHRDRLKGIFPGSIETDYTSEQLRDLVTQQWNIFHLVANTRTASALHALDAWKKLIGQHAIPLDDPKDLAQVIVSTIQVAEGSDKDAVSSSWSGSTAVTVANAIKDVTAVSKDGKSGGVVRL